MTCDEQNNGELNVKAPEWYLATTKPKQEVRAVENLQNQGINAFSPTCKVERIKSGKRTVVTEALFPGYVFIKLSQADALWHKVLSTRGVRAWVRFANTIAQLPVKLVADLVEQEQVLEARGAESVFSTGAIISIISGPFQGLSGIYQVGSGEERSMILINFLGQENLIRVNNTHLQIV